MKKAYDLESVYDEQIYPLMDKIVAICKENKMPFIADFQYTGEGHRCTTVFFPEDRTICPVLEAAYKAIKPRTIPAMNITTRDKDGKIVSMETIL